MKAVGGDSRAPQSPRELIGEQDVGQLGLAVRPVPIVAPLALEVGKVQLRSAVGARRDVDDSGGYSGPQTVQQQIREQEISQVVDGKLLLQAINRELAPAGKHPGIVDQDVESRVALPDLAGRSSDLTLGRQVCRYDLGYGSRPAADL